MVAAGNQTADPAEAIALYQRAEDMLLEDMPAIPVYFGRTQYVHSERVTALAVDGFGGLRTDQLAAAS